MLRSPLSLSFETPRFARLLRMRLKGRLEAEAELITRKTYDARRRWRLRSNMMRERARDALSER